MERTRRQNTKIRALFLPVFSGVAKVREHFATQHVLLHHVQIRTVLQQAQQNTAVNG